MTVALAPHTDYTKVLAHVLQIAVALASHTDYTATTLFTDGVLVALASNIGTGYT